MAKTSDSINFRSFRDSCKNCSLSELCLPRGLEPEDMESLDNVIKQRRVLHEGNYLFQQGEENRQIYAVRSGSVKTFTHTVDGDTQVMGFHLPGEIVGLDGLDEAVHHCSAQALETTSVCELPLSDFEDICTQIPSLQRQLLKLVSREISQDHKMLMLLAKKNSEQRLATFLLSLSGRFHMRGLSEDSFLLSMRRQDIASYLGLAVETVSRILSKFDEMKVLNVERKSIEILDREKLFALSEN